MANSKVTIIMICLGLILYLTGGGADAARKIKDEQNNPVKGHKPPTISLSANPTTLTMNCSTTINWSSKHASDCTASGDWSGSKATSGFQTISALTTNSSFNLSCSGAGGTVNDTVNVAVVLSNNGTALLSWMPPTENTDGSTLTDLAGYKVYYGTSSGSYCAPITINNPGLSSYMVENLGISDWFIVITSFNSSGIESSYSTEVSKTIN